MQFSLNVGSRLCFRVFNITLSRRKRKPEQLQYFLQLKKKKKKKKKKKRRKTPFSDVIPMQRIPFHFTCKRGCQ